MAGKTPKEYTRAQFRRDMEDRSFGLASFATVSLIFAIVLFVIAFMPVKELNAQRKTQVAIVNMFDVDGTHAAQVKQRQKLATSILAVKQFDGSIPEFQDATLEKQLATIAKTGQPLDLKPVELNESGRWLFVLFWWALGTLCLSWLGYGVRYWDLCHSKHYRLWALPPWHRAWAWVVPLRAPWLVPFLISSLLWAWCDSYRANKATRKE